MGSSGVALPSRWAQEAVDEGLDVEEQVAEDAADLLPTSPLTSFWCLNSLQIAKSKNQ